MSAKLRILLADDHPVVLAGIKALLVAEPGLEIVGEARNGRTAVKLAIELAPDIAVIDLSMPGLTGIEVARDIHDACPSCKVLALTVHEDGAYLRQLLEVGGVGYVLKRSASEELLRAISVAADGGVYLDPAIRTRLAGQGVARPASPEGPAEPDLSEREIRVLRLTAAGYSNKTIADKLRIAVKTVETYKARAMGKLGFHSRVEIVRYALGKNWLAEE
ncbi:response regulator transcription factor [Rhodoplanes sp. TEM]|uniref:Response regulator transcription factor n=1 Tax=Rhodoplanes tepidamans TaxID=200616 RepID=A0ABT5J5Q3_RHOTP|nr:MULTISPECIES: response regulator transcription factor [Rhodoplanes]MDC7784982.1 response regulator transcription factor [Rhodoplanes tepidamans]MDC7985850.1 response regulator transcription factor [Rhodoplanes sp. TEM]MDQ0353788.1 DNA-binding NarL/FixJ family response regulator [Rhodoplanes tepidamans]